MVFKWILGVLCLSVWGCVAQNIDCTLRNNTCSTTNVGTCDELTGVCSCNTTSLNTTIDCFVLNNETNFCDRLRCFEYFGSDGECREGSKNRLTALLLSIFLINFGAANFYIERYELAVPQIILGLFLCVFQVGSCAAAGKRDGDTSIPCIICCSINSFLSLLFLAWWLADLIIFATNTRNDGDDCPLYT